MNFTDWMNLSWFWLFLLVAGVSLFAVIIKQYMDDGARIILTLVGFASWIAIGFWLLDGTVMLAWGLATTDFAFIFIQWLPFFVSIIPVAISINRWGKVKQTAPFGRGGQFEEFAAKPRNRTSGYDSYKVRLQSRTRGGRK